MAKAPSCLSLFILGFALFTVCKASEEIGIYELQTGYFSVNITNYGATVLSVIVPDRNGKLDDIVLGFGSIDGYKNDSTYFGALVGRVANRIGGAQFTLKGKVYKLPANDHGNTLHGGYKGFSDVIWTVKEHVKDSHLTLTYDSHDGEQGFPGEVSVTVTYLLIGENKFGIKMEAKSLTKPTPINLASHTYWNLGGHNSGNILSHIIQLQASRITPVDDKLIPTGEISPVRGTAYDFLEPRTIGSKFNELPEGYDINYVLDRTGSGIHFTKVASVWDEKSGRKLEMRTDQPGVQFYTSNMLKDTVGKGGFVYKKCAGFCLETQGFPDSVNHRNFPSQIVNPGQSYRHVMVYRFTAI
ncbi:putative mutarotase [Handroanthus impetiginosus]|uniref:Aldose 1-epimerase n=1 Tax=Handroanthus impetiginosus TaxID=429701 RepID=A0A2G9HSZ9_9LAMI|nr:putative mutarotase [Handroanthus impetiginosus]